MYDLSKEILDYHDNKVRLPEATQNRLRNHRNANRDRVTSGLAKQEGPMPLGFIKQGSYAMRTINREFDNGYDIDDGVVFSASDLHRDSGGELSSLEARKMVCEAVSDPAFSTQPEVRKNCVRIYYSEGHHVDMPVYREWSDHLGAAHLELASSTWRKSNPEGVTEWFNTAVHSKSPDDTNGRQMRRIVRLLKSFARSRRTWNMPSGFVLTVLVDESYMAYSGRDDRAFYDTLLNIKSRLAVSRIVRHPVVDEYLVSVQDDTRMRELEAKASWALEVLGELNQRGCTRLSALQAWKEVFNTSHFDGCIEEERMKERAAAIAVAASLKVQPSPWYP